MGTVKGFIHNHDSRKCGNRRQASIQRSYDRYVGKKALYEEWEMVLEPDDPYLLTLKKKVDVARHLLETKTGDKLEPR